ncbi:hypothetical protein WMY93_014185 [Mugilogobius chulae]|uniref:C-type lectin domain-containing protein n=1 Tax=Mugilogobius chulae TaxID=88201 RepID=A0AAW0NYB7_9GOBI
MGHLYTDHMYGDAALRVYKRRVWSKSVPQTEGAKPPVKQVMSQTLSLDVCIMKLLLLCLLFGAVVALTTAAPAEPEPNNGAKPNVEDPDMQDPESVDEMEMSEDPESVDEMEMSEDPESVDEMEMSEAENEDSAENSCNPRCKPRTWCTGSRTRSGRQYIYIPSTTHWAYAQYYCQYIGGTLAVIQDRATDNFLKNLAHGRAAWIGYSDAEYNGYWFWANGERAQYSNWCRGEPNNLGGRQACAVINWTHLKCWDDQNCDTYRPFICQK